MHNDDLLQTSLDELRSKLDIIDAEMVRGQPPAEALTAIEHAVSAVRRDIWVLLTAQHADDIRGYTGKIRIRRATEMCEEVLADLHAETLPPNTPGLEVFHATLRELSKVWRETALHLEGAA
jgi:hypothetical protein